jgi:5'-nucleotidase
MKLLVTNDDGVNAKGIYALIKELEKYHEVLVVAPDDQRSASSHSITLTRPLKVKEVLLEGIKAKAYSVDGTPADCVRIALDQLTEGAVDLVVSGINRGFNLGADILYSGTVSAAIEAAIYKVPSIAVSMDVTDNIEDYEIAAKYGAKVVQIAKEQQIDSDLVLNVNVPLLKEEAIKGIKVCKIGSVVYNNYFEESLLEQEKGQRTFDIKGRINKDHKDETDTRFINEGYVTLTPLHYDLTNFKILTDVSKWF